MIDIYGQLPSYYLTRFIVGI